MIPTIIATLPRFIAKHYKSLAFALLALFALYQRHEANKWHDRAIACQTASQAAAAQTKAMRAAERRQYEEQARHADQEHTEALADARAAADRYIAAHRVRPSGYQRPAEPIGEAGVARLPESLPAATDVGVSEQDVRTCGDLYQYALDAREWAHQVTGN